MFWGRGDTAKLDPDVQTTLAHLRRMEETGHIVALTHDQTQAALRALTFYGRWEGTLALLTSIRNVVLLIGALLAIYFATEGWIIARIREVVAG